MRRNHKGYRVGEGHQRAKLSDADVRRMRAMYAGCKVVEALPGRIK